MNCSCLVEGQVMIGLIDVRLYQSDMSCSSCVLTMQDVILCRTESECSTELGCEDDPEFNNFKTFNDLSKILLTLSGLSAKSMPLMVWVQVSKKGKQEIEDLTRVVISCETNETSVRFCLSHGYLKRNFSALKAEKSSVENIMVSRTVSGYYTPLVKCFVTCGHKIFMT